MDGLDSRPLKRARRAVVYLLVLSGALGVSVPFLAGETTFTILGLYLAIPFILAASMFNSTRQELQLPLGFGHSKAWFKGLLVGYLLIQWISVVVLLVSDVRPLVYYGLVAIMLVIVLVQILYFEVDEPRTVLILGEIGLVTVNLIWGVTLKYYYFLGRSDVFPHVWYIEQLLSQHVIVGFNTYQPHPLWHLLVGFETWLFGLPVAPRYIMFFTSGLLYFVGIVAVYALARTFGSSTRLALTAALFVPLNTWVVFYGAYSIPRSIVAVLFTMLLLVSSKRGLRAVVLVTLLSVGIVMFHTVSGIFLMIILAVYLFIQSVLRPGSEYLGVHHCLTFIAIQAGYFLTAGRPTLVAVLNAVTAHGTGGALGGLERPVAELVNYAGFSILIFFVLVGILVTLFSRTQIDDRGPAILTAAVLAPLSFPSPLQIAGPASAFNLLRFGEYTYPFISIAGAVGLLALVRARFRFELPAFATGLSRVVNFRTLVLLLVLSGAFLAVSNDWAASDNPLEKRVFYTFYFTQSEIQGLNKAGELAEGFVMTDALACKYLANSPHGSKCHILEVNQREGILHTSGPDDLILVRDRELDGRPLQLYEAETFVPNPSYAGRITYVGEESTVWADVRSRNKVFVSDSLVGYTGATGP